MKHTGVGLHRPLPALCLHGLLLNGPCAYRHSVVSSCKEGPSCPTDIALLQMLALRSPSCVCVCMYVCMRACLPACVCDMAFPRRAEHFSLHIVCLCFHHQLLQKEASPMKRGRSTHLQVPVVSMCKLLKR